MYKNVSKEKFLRHLYHEVGLYPSRPQLRILDELLAGKDNEFKTKQKIKDKAWLIEHLNIFKEKQNDPAYK